MNFGCSDGSSTTLHASCTNLVSFLRWHMFEKCIRRWGCAGRSFPSHSTSQVPRHGGSEAHGASKSRPSDLKLALVTAWYGPAVCAVSSRQIRHIADGKLASGCSHMTPGTGRPLPAYSRRLVSLQAARSLCHAIGMHASRRQQLACVWNAAADGRCVRHHGNRCDLNEAAARG